MMPRGTPVENDDLDLALLFRQQCHATCLGQHHAIATEGKTILECRRTTWHNRDSQAELLYVPVCTLWQMLSDMPQEILVKYLSSG